MEKLNFLLPDARSWQGTCDSWTLAKNKADTYNRTDGTLTGFSCRKCRNRGGFLVPHEDGSVTYQDCSCMKQRRSLRRMENSGLQSQIRDKTFAAFEAGEPWQQKLKAGAEGYAEEGEGWFLLAGQSGCGKTHLCTAICRERLLQGREVVYMAWREEISRLKALSLDSEARDRQLKTLKTAELLYIDDLFKTGKSQGLPMAPSAADLNLAFEILNFRYIQNLQTVISTELSFEELVDLDEALGGRILEKSAASQFCIDRNISRNYRLRGLQGHRDS